MKVCIRFLALCHDWFLNALLFFDWSVILPLHLMKGDEMLLSFLFKNLIILWFHGLIYI